MGGSNKKGTGGGGSGGGGAEGGGSDDCPLIIPAILTSPARIVLAAGDPVEAVLIVGTPSVVAVKLSATGDTIGTLAGVPNLAQLALCLAKGVPYSGTIDNVSGGAIHVRLFKG